MTDLPQELCAALILKLTALADDELLLAQRGGEWVGHAPILEEDIALANLAQDELGHAQSWLALRAGLDGSDPDALAFLRDAGGFRSARLLELPRGDWAFTLTRHFLFDAYEALWLSEARRSAYMPLAEAAAKMLKEERFHLQHTALWMRRLGLGTPESNRRTQEALNVLWPLAGQLFAPVEGEALLVQAGIAPDLANLYEPWAELVGGHLKKSGLTLSEAEPQTWSRERHTEHLIPLLQEMQAVARADPEASAW